MSLEKPLLLYSGRISIYRQGNVILRVGSSEDIAKAAIFCLENEWLTGQFIGVDGGMSTVRV